MDTGRTRSDRPGPNLRIAGCQCVAAASRWPGVTILRAAEAAAITAWIFKFPQQAPAGPGAGPLGRRAA